MISRKNFLKATALGGLLPLKNWATEGTSSFSGTVEKPVAISTWNHGVAANKSAWKVLEDDGSALDAVEAGVRVTEANPDVRTVGVGGRPDRDGNVTLDACIMDENQRCGSVGALQHIVHPVSVARQVKTDTPHVMLVGDGALDLRWNRGSKRPTCLPINRKRSGKNGRKRLITIPK